MKFTKLELEIINHRLEVPCAMAECLADTIGISYTSAFAHTEFYLPTLISKLENNEELTSIEDEFVHDIATCKVFSSIAHDAIGETWDTTRMMTASWSARINNTEENLSEKLLKAIGRQE